MNGTSHTESESYYIGVRVKKNELMQLMKIDLTEHIKKFYTYMMTKTSEDQYLSEALTNRNIELQIRYMTRD